MFHLFVYRETNDFAMNTRLLFLLIILIPLNIFAQKTMISGSVSGAEGQVVRLLAFDDFVSRKIISLDESPISAEGTFSLEFDLPATQAAFLDINYQRSEIFLEPGQNYELSIAYDAANQLRSYFDRQGLTFEILRQEENELNKLIWEFNAMYNKFVMENFEHIVKLHDKDRVARFKEEVLINFEDAEHPYFQDYIEYKFADIEQYARLKGEKLLAEEYFNTRPILYRNVEYTFLFEEFFEKFLTTSPDVILISDLIQAVNEEENLQTIRDSLAAVPYLENKVFRDLVLIYSLKGLYHNGTFKKPQVLSLIREAGKTSPYPEHRKIANNLLEVLSRLDPGNPAPDIELTGMGGQKFKLKSIKGKPMLLVFFRGQQSGMSNTFDRLAELYQVYKAGLEIISISMDHRISDYQDLANSGNYPWTFTHYGGNPSVYDAYDVRNMPLFVLIDTDGNIVSHPAPAPGDELERQILKIIH